MKLRQIFRPGTAALIIALPVIVLDLLFLASPKKEFSENENRYLASFPKITAESISSGDFTAELNHWLSDHFPFRDGFMNLKTQAELLEGRKEINGIFIGRDGYLIEPYQKPEHPEKTIRCLKGFYEALPEAVETRLMLVPTAVWTLTDKLPTHAPVKDEREDAETIVRETGIQAVDCFTALKEAAEETDAQLYYKSDHHWTTYGAYCGYRAYCESAGITPLPLSSWEAETVTEEFLGTIYSKVNDYSMQGDSIVSFSHPEDKLTVLYEDTGKESKSLYDPEYLSKKDKYSYFLSNLHPFIMVTNEAAETERALVVIKDSYANSMVPFLAHHFKKVCIFDTRYYKTGPSYFIKEHPEVTDVLILYNINTLDTDPGIGGIY